MNFPTVFVCNVSVSIHRVKNKAPNHMILVIWIFVSCPPMVLGKK